MKIRKGFVSNSSSSSFIIKSTKEITYDNILKNLENEYDKHLIDCYHPDAIKLTKSEAIKDFVSNFNDNLYNYNLEIEEKEVKIEKIIDDGYVAQVSNSVIAKWIYDRILDESIEHRTVNYIIGILASIEDHEIDSKEFFIFLKFLASIYPKKLSNEIHFYFNYFKIKNQLENIIQFLYDIAAMFKAHHVRFNRQASTINKTIDKLDDLINVIDQILHVKKIEQYKNYFDNLRNVLIDCHADLNKLSENNIESGDSRFWVHYNILTDFTFINRWGEIVDNRYLNELKIKNMKNVIYDIIMHILNNQVKFVKIVEIKYKNKFKNNYLINIVNEIRTALRSLIKFKKFYSIEISNDYDNDDVAEYLYAHPQIVSDALSSETTEIFDVY